MNLAHWFQRPGPVPPPAAASPPPNLPGDRGIPSINRARSLQSRLGSVLAVSLMSALGVGLLAFYYAHAYSRTGQVRTQAQAASQTRAQGDAPLPALGPLHPPALAHAAAASAPPTLAEQMLGPAPPLPDGVNEAGGSLAPMRAPPSAVPGSAAPHAHRARPLSGAVFAAQSSDAPYPVSARPAVVTESSASEGAFEGAASRADGAAPRSEGGPLATALQPTATPAVRAQLLPTQRLLLPKGAFIDCTLETAIDSSLAGLTTCITATDTFGADGQVVLLERGTKLVGETRGEVRQGGARVFVLWTEARTPTGVVIPLASPGTDELGRAGLTGTVNRHFWDRFGAAILVSVINGAVQAAAQSTTTKSGAVIVNPSSSTEVMTEVLRETVAIPPTVTKPQGDRIQVLVARDLDFRSVYELRHVTAATGEGAP